MLKLFVFASALMITAAGVASENPVAQVGERQITSDQLDREWKRKNGSAGVADGQEGQVGEVLVDLIQFELVYAEASRLDYASKPEVARAIQRLIVEQYIKDTLVPQLADISVNDDEIANYYQANLDLFRFEPKTRGAMIQVSVAPTTSESKRAELRERAEKARAEAIDMADSATDFGSIAVKFSDHQATRYRGGDIGWLSDGSVWAGRLGEAFAALEGPGAISDVIENEAGFYVLRLVERQPGGVKPLPAVSQEIRHRLMLEKRESTKIEFYAGLGQDIEVHFDQESLDRWLAEAAERKQVPPGTPN